MDLCKHPASRPSHLDSLALTELSFSLAGIECQANQASATNDECQYTL